MVNNYLIFFFHIKYIFIFVRQLFPFVFTIIKKKRSIYTLTTNARTFHKTRDTAVQSDCR